MVNRTILSVAALLTTALLALCGCSDSKSRAAARRLYDAKEQADEILYEIRVDGEAGPAPSAMDLLKGSAPISESRKRRLTGTQDVEAARALAAWILDAPGRSNILVDENRLSEILGAFSRRRDVLSRIQIQGREIDAELRAEYDAIREGDLPPALPDNPRDLDAVDWANEQRKAAIIERLKNQDARERILESVLNRLTARTLLNWVERDLDRAEILTAEQSKARQMLAGWAEDTTTLNAIASVGLGDPPTEMPAPAQEAIRNRLAAEAPRDRILDLLRQSQVVELSELAAPEEEVLQKLEKKLEKAGGILREALRESADAPPEARQIAQRSLAEVKAMQARYHGKRLAAARRRQQAALDIALRVVNQIRGQMDRIARSDKARSGDSAGEDPAKMAQSAAEARAKVESLKQEMMERKAAFEKARDEAQSLDVAAASALAEVQTSQDEQVRRKKLDEFIDLRSRADASAREAVRLSDELRAMELDIQIAQVAAQEALKRQELAEKTSTETVDRREEIARRGRKAQVEYLRSRRQLRGLIRSVSEAGDLAAEQRQAATEALTAAAGHAGKAGRKGASEAARLAIEQAQLAAGAVAVRRHGLVVAREIAQLAGKSVPGVDNEDLRQSVRSLLEGLGFEPAEDAATDAMLTAAAEKIDARANEVLAEYQAVIDEDGSAAGRDVLAAAYLSKARMAPDPQPVFADAKANPALSNLLTSAAPPIDSVAPMRSVRRLRAMMGLRTVPKPAPRPAPTPGTPAEPAPTEPGAPGDDAGPKDVLGRMRQSALAGDTNAFLQCFTATPRQAEALRGMARLVNQATQFLSALKAQYPADNAAVKEMSSRLDDAASLAREDWLSGVTVSVEGDTATATAPGEDRPLSLVKQDGRWKIQAGSIIGGTGPDDEMAAGMMAGLTNAMADAIERARGMIGKPDVMPEKILEELKRAEESMMPGPDAPGPAPEPEAVMPR